MSDISDNECPSSSNETTSQELQGWNKQEKIELLKALKLCHSDDIPSISQHILTKTPDQITEALRYYKKKIEDTLTVKESTLKNCKLRRGNVPLGSWANLLTDSLKHEELQSETVTALRLIAEYENLSKPVNTADIDFKSLYLMIADSLEGKPFKAKEKNLKVIEKCILETAMNSKLFKRKIDNALQRCHLSDKEILRFPMPTTHSELACIRHLIAQRKYNPFNFSEDCLLLE